MEWNGWVGRLVGGGWGVLAHPQRTVFDWARRYVAPASQAAPGACAVLAAGQLLLTPLGEAAAAAVLRMPSWCGRHAAQGTEHALARLQA